MPARSCSSNGRTPVKVKFHGVIGVDILRGSGGGIGHILRNLAAFQSTSDLLASAAGLSRIHAAKE
jgi:hypothetical protein